MRSRLGGKESREKRWVEEDWGRPRSSPVPSDFSARTKPEEPSSESAVNYVTLGKKKGERGKRRDNKANLHRRELRSR